MWAIFQEEEGVGFYWEEGVEFYWEEGEVGNDHQMMQMVWALMTVAVSSMEG